jgi:hypothetical protein
MALNELAVKYRTDKKIPDGVPCQNGLEGHGYTTQYEKLFTNREIKTLLEIGVSYGGSIKMWDEYFGGSCFITGVDIHEKRFKRRDLEKSNIRIKIGNQGDPEFLKALCDINYDVIIDDGSHKSDDQLIAFNELFNALNSNGIYIIEDLHSPKATITVRVFESCHLNGDYHKSFLKEDVVSTIRSVDFYQAKKLCVVTRK